MLLRHFPAFKHALELCQGLAASPELCNLCRICCISFQVIEHHTTGNPKPSNRALNFIHLQCTLHGEVLPPKLSIWTDSLEPLLDASVFNYPTPAAAAAAAASTTDGQAEAHVVGEGEEEREGEGRESGLAGVVAVTDSCRILVLRSFEVSEWSERVEWVRGVREWSERRSK